MNPNKIKRIVIWGLKKKYHTHRHIHQAFYKNAKKLGYSTLWLEDEKKSQKYILPGDLIITADPVGKMVPEKFKLEEYYIPVRDDIYYCLHNMKDIFERELNKNNYINLKTYNNSISESSSTEKWSPVTFFDTKDKILYQPWGTDLLPHEFKKPVYNKNHILFWIGSIWNDKKNHGNINEMNELKMVLKKNKILFFHLRFIPDILNIFFIRLSRIAPAIAGSFQTQIGYLPCRVFKNISYGQLGITNIKEFELILKDSFVKGSSIEELIENCLSLNETDYVTLVEKQQEHIKNYTYKNSIENIIRAIEDYDN